LIRKKEMRNNLHLKQRARLPEDADEGRSPEDGKGVTQEEEDAIKYISEKEKKNGSIQV